MDDDPIPNFGGETPSSPSSVAPETEVEVEESVPSFENVYADPKDPEDRGFEDSFVGVYAPSFYKGMIDAATFLIDLPTQGAGYVLGEGAEALGFEESAKRLKNPILLSDVVKAGFEAPATIQEAVTGEPAGFLSRSFDATPRKAQSEEERFFRDVSYISGGALSFPTSLAKAGGTFKKPIQKLLSDASGRSANSEAARKAIGQASKTKGPNAAQALANAASEYANKYTVGLGTKTKKTLLTEQGLATAAGIGYAAPEMFADDDGKIMFDAGDGSFDAAPTFKVLASMGLPIILAHGPTGILLGGDTGKVGNLVRYVRDKGKVFARSLLGGFSEKGRMDLSSKIFNSLESERGVLENILLPAIESGQFSSPGASTPIKILDDGTVVPEFGGIRQDTLQALKQLGVDDTRLAALDASLSGRGTNLQQRVSEETRRAERLDETFELLKSRLGSGDEAGTFKTIEKIESNLSQEAVESADAAIQKAADVFESLEPAIGRAEASKIAVEMLDGARKASQQITRKLFAKELIGTDTVDTRSLGDFAVKVIREVGERNIPITPGMGFFYKLAGKARLEKEGLLPSGKPITNSDLKGAKGDGDELLTADEIPEQGLYDIFGEPGTIYASPVRIETVQNFRSEVGDAVRKAYAAGNQKVGRRIGLIIDYIDDEILAAKNFEGKVAPENIKNIEIGREYVKDAKARFGPNSEIGKALFKGADKLDEGFLSRLLKRGPESGARVGLFRNALNEPVQVIQDGNVTWQRDPAATLTLGDNPNVIEADLLLRYTEGLAGGKVEQKSIDRFVTQYSDAIDAVPGLRNKFNDLKSVQQAVDETTAKLTLPNKDGVLAAYKAGATLEDIANARRINRDNLQDRQIANTASEYVGVDVNQAAKNYMDSNPKKIVQRSEELAALLAKDETGFAEKGFRAALWRVLRDNSRRVGPEGEPLPGLNTRKLTEDIEKYRPFLEKFYDKSSMEFLDELVKGGPLQQTGTDSPFAGTPQEVMRAEFGTVETVGAAGRTLGQKAFGVLGINPLVATGMGKRIAAYTFTKLGEAKILKNVEDALRDPEKAANLIRRYKQLEDVEVPGRQIAEDVLEDPTGTALRGASTAKDRLSETAGFANRYLKAHSKEAIERAVKFGLVPAQAEAKRMTLEDDYKMGPPFVYEDNRIRYEIETREEPLVIEIPNPGPQSAVQPAAQPVRPMAAAMPPPRAPRADSTLGQVNPVGPPPMAQAPASQETLAGLSQLGMPLFAKEGGYIEKSGIMSVKPKARQLVG